MKRIQRTAAVALTGLLLATGVVSAASATDASPAAAAKECRTTVRKAAKAQVLATKSVTDATAAYAAALATYASHDYSVKTEQKAAIDAYRVLVQARKNAQLAINFTYNCAVRAAVKVRNAAVDAATTDEAKATANTAFKTAIAAAKKAKADAMKALAPLPDAPAGMQHGKPAKPAKP